MDCLSHMVSLRRLGWFGIIVSFLSSKRAQDDCAREDNMMLSFGEKGHKSEVACRKSSDTTAWLLSRPKTRSGEPEVVYLSSD